ncbi:MAG: thiol:disulfide oxidoreductase, partial [Cyanobacteria bacterium P01_H01_bin.121]
PHETQQQNLNDFPNLKRWFATIQARPAVVKAYEVAKVVSSGTEMTEANRKILFGQTASSGQ